MTHPFGLSVANIVLHWRRIPNSISWFAWTYCFNICMNWIILMVFWADNITCRQVHRDRRHCPYRHVACQDPLYVLAKHALPGPLGPRQGSYTRNSTMCVCSHVAENPFTLLPTTEGPAFFHHKQLELAIWKGIIYPCEQWKELSQVKLRDCDKSKRTKRLVTGKKMNKKIILH